MIDASPRTEVSAQPAPGPPAWATAVRRLAGNPLVVKDGLSRIRTWRAPATIGIYLGLLGLFAGLVFSLQMTGAQRAWGFAEVGSAVFTALAVVQLALVCLFTPGVAAGAISGERERQTLDVLLVTCVSAFSIVWGKLVASVAFIVVLILAALPIFATVFLFGGIDGQQFVVAQLLTVTTAVTTGAVSVFASAVFRRTLAATVTAYGLTFAGTAGTWVVGNILTQIAVVQAAAGGASVVSAQTYTHGLLYVNPIHAMTTLLQGGSGVPLGRAVQSSFLSATPLTGAGPVIEPWQSTVVAQLLLVTLSVAGAVWLVRGMRASRRGD